jgi:hypothetical protein
METDNFKNQNPITPLTENVTLNEEILTTTETETVETLETFETTELTETVLVDINTESVFYKSTVTYYYISISLLIIIMFLLIKLVKRK